MRKVSTVRGKAVPIDRENVDTDQIVPARRLKRVERTGFGEFAFERWRKDPAFPLNNPAYRGARVMITRSGFGSGSSREHAVWAIQGLGIEALIGPSFADIFKGNCLQCGVLTVELVEEDVDSLMRLVVESPGTEVAVDLEAQTVSVPDGAWERRFEIDPFHKRRLRRGLDDISMTLERSDDIDAHERRRDPTLPSLAPRP